MRTIKKVAKFNLVSLRFILFIVILGGAYLIIRYKDTFNNQLPVDVYYLQTKNEANITLIQQGEKAILIDTGEQKDQKELLAFLNEKKVTKIDDLIITHPDKDHIGNAATILETLDVVHVIMPYYGKENKDLEQVTSEVERQGISLTYPSRPRNFTVGGLHVTIYPPLEKHYKKDNNYSLGILLKHQKVNFLFVGDSESKRLQELMAVNWPAIDAYLVAHHGRANLSSEGFINQIQPKIAVTTADANDQEVQQALDAIGTKMYFTMNGTVHLSSDGQTLVVKE
ncbi:MBL fold metallo-hydrolase [Enterococcus saccharolyticus]|uniref:ComEC/Rec2 family competence protein n=1 Tax=Enterococcus saccharolyticus TaxID=41997 RepID=UPI001E555793|nr:MBL fold metallo-hydrolase [Enterococcus saccharolyticus]MCD5002546.1 MBL fold metallo-hydrolase [Enterococcus saccharolyticus]